MAAKKKKTVKAIVPNATLEPNHESIIERSVHYFSRAEGWIDKATSFDDFKSGKTKQFSFHQVGALPGQVRAAAWRYSLDLQTFFWKIGYAATGNTVAEIAEIAEKPDNEMQALLTVAVAGYQKIVP